MFKQKRMLLVFLLPGMLGLLVFYVLPFFGGIYFSVTDGTRQNAFVGMANYLSVWQNQMFRLGLVNTLQLSLICAPLIFVSSFLLAGLLKGLGERSKGYRNVLLLPYLMPSAAMLILFLLLFDYGGPVNRALQALGMPRVLWKESDAMRVPVIALYVWKNLGFSVVIFSSALQAVPGALYEYAQLEGASRLRQEISITLPMISPTAFLVFVLAWINAFKIFKEVYFIGGSYPDMSCYTLQHFMNNMFQRLNYQYVTTAAYSFAVIVLALFGVLYAIEARRRVVM
ncbi:MAG TPA: sugar ABC transporter permease [Candidatus Onthenecus intestinigallinarum]|uniref:Sugar ABC transporter permease n=1 Tax=Candidatus Onthenecus intestinigallinarum TaxID=2840875 RepID=A0A9D1CQE2_9FIRM|nr:sugar ABC transporter permease [Candidatus Onthenecus intestinigallinarum]